MKYSALLVLALVASSGPVFAETSSDRRTCSDAADFKTALAACTRTAASKDNEVRGAALRRRAGLWRERGEYDKAFADIATAIDLSPSNKYVLADLYATRGDIQRLRGNLDASIADLNQAIKLESGITYFYVMRGDTYRYRGEFDNAIIDYDLAIIMWKDYGAGPYTGLGLIYERQGKLDEAKDNFRKAIAAGSHPDSRAIGASERSAKETAIARLAALENNSPRPILPQSPLRGEGHSIPTPTLPPSAAPNRMSMIAEHRVALVIGNSGYRAVPGLPNPAKDAELVASTLRNIGFTVTLSIDATRADFADVLRRFAQQAEKADWALVYYAGHGIEVHGQNYLIPVDAKLSSDRAIQSEAIGVEQVQSALSRARKLSLIILDACRDNPFAAQTGAAAAEPAQRAAGDSSEGGTTRSIARGLSEAKPTGASLIAFAAKHGHTALDGDGGNSPFAIALVQRIIAPNIELNKVFRLIRDDVMEATAGRQEPYTYGSLPGREEFYFVTTR